MSNFYHSIAAHYDHIFPTRPPQISFVATRVKPEGCILDVGCATGGLAVALAQNGYTVTAIDLDDEMIELATDKVAHLGAKVSFRVADMTRLGETNGYDGVICLGNTLVHLEAPGVANFLSWAKNSLHPGGRFICQILNYHRIEKENMTSLPPIENDAVRFCRTYRRNQRGELFFHTVLDVKETGEVFENEIQLFPLDYEKIKTLLSQAGFTHVELFGDLLGSPFSPDTSFPLVIAAS